MVLADGRATFACSDDDCSSDGEVCVVGSSIAGLLQCFGCTSIEPMLSIEPLNTELAEEVGLTRQYRVNFQDDVVHPGMTELFSLVFSTHLEYAVVSPFAKLFAVTPNDPMFADQWNFDNYGQAIDFQGETPTDWGSPGAVPPGTAGADIDMPEAWELETGDGRVVIAVIDTGVDLDHPDLVNNLIAGHNFHPGLPGFPSDPNDPSDSIHYAHGTFIAGIIGAQGNNSVGIAGMNWNCKIMPLRVTDIGYPWSYFEFATNAEAICYATDNGADVINMSWGRLLEDVPAAPKILGPALRYADGMGVVLVAGTGNFDGAVIAYPAIDPLTIAVGATTSTDDWASGFSNSGLEISVTAPGSNIVSTWNDAIVFNGIFHYPCEEQQYCLGTGTSFSAPHVSGLAALILSANDQLTNVEVRDIIETTADDLGQLGFDPLYGHGRINAYRAVCEARRRKCIGDTNKDDVVDVNDLLAVIGAWGSGAGVGDVDCDYVVAVGDLLDVIAEWGLCPNTQGTAPASLADEITSSGLDWPADWNTYQSILTTGTQEEKENANCWMNHYLLHCNPPPCEDSGGECAGSDPFN